MRVPRSSTTRTSSVLLMGNFLSEGASAETNSGAVHSRRQHPILDLMADTISFARGAPSLDIVDQEGLREAAQRAFSNDPGGTFAYGTSVGYVPLREWIAEQHGVEPDQVLVTNGSMQADAFLFQLMIGPGDAVIVESPTYDRTLLNLRNRGADVRMVELETDGIDVDGVASLLEHPDFAPKLAHIIPNFQNPAG